MTNRAAGDLISEADWDAFQGNIEYLLNPNSSELDLTTGNVTMSSSGSFADLTGITRTVTSNGGPILIIFHAQFSDSSNSQVDFDLLLDGATEGGTAGIVNLSITAGAYYMLSFVHAVAPAAGSHTIKLQARTSAGTLTVYATAANPTYFKIVER